MMEPEWISLNEFMRRNHIGYETALQLINSGKVECQKLGSQYKIKVSKNEQINKENEALIRRVQELETQLKTIQTLVNQIRV